MFSALFCFVITFCAIPNFILKYCVYNSIMLMNMVHFDKETSTSCLSDIKFAVKIFELSERFRPYGIRKNDLYL